MAELKCPACGSSDAAAIQLSLIAARYYQCQKCVATFREAGRPQESAGNLRFSRIKRDPRPKLP